MKMGRQTASPHWTFSV